MWYSSSTLFSISLHETSVLELLGGGLVLIALLTSQSCFFLLLFMILKMVNGFLRFPGSVLLWYSVWTLFYLFFFSLSCLIFLPFLVLPLKLRVCLRREPQMSSFECSKGLDCSMLIGTVALLWSPCIYLLLK